MLYDNFNIDIKENTNNTIPKTTNEDTTSGSKEKKLPSRLRIFLIIDILLFLIILLILCLIHGCSRLNEEKKNHNYLHQFIDLLNHYANRIDQKDDCDTLVTLSYIEENSSLLIVGKSESHIFHLSINYLDINFITNKNDILDNIETFKSSSEHFTSTFSYLDISKQSNTSFLDHLFDQYQYQNIISTSSETSFYLTMKDNKNSYYSLSINKEVSTSGLTSNTNHYFDAIYEIMFKQKINQ